MKLPRDPHGEDRTTPLSRLGHRVVRRTGSPLRPTWNRGGREHPLSLPRHHPLGLGTLAGVLREMAEAQGLTREGLLKLLDL